MLWLPKKKKGVGIRCKIDGKRPFKIITSRNNFTVNEGPICEAYIYNQRKQAERTSFSRYVLNECFINLTSIKNRPSSYPVHND